MKKQIFAHLDEGGAGLDPVTLAALQKLKADMHGMSTAAEAQAAAEAAAVHLVFYENFKEVQKQNEKYNR